MPSSAAAAVDAAQPFGQGEGAVGLGLAGQELAGPPAQRMAIVPALLLCSALGHERVLSEPNVEQDAATARIQLRPAA